MTPIIIHLDMNSYFATVEQQDHVEWRKKPLGVCEHLGGIIIAASVEAKRWGIKTGTPVWEARKYYPKIILTQTHADRYRLYIKRAVKVAEDYTDFVEQASIDEMYIDITKACNIRSVQNGELAAVNPFEEAVGIALEIKRRMKKEVGDYLTCTIGIGDNKLVAKIASDMQKPDGLVIITESPVNNKPPKALVFNREQLYHNLKLTDIPGIARRTEKNLNKLGIRTLMDLKNFPPSVLVGHFGIIGYHLHKMGQLKGSWKPKVEFDDSIKSIGHMYTLPKEFREKKFFVPVLYKLSEMVAKRLRKQNLTGNIISFYLRDKDYGSFGESKKLGFYVYDGREIFMQCMLIFERFDLPKGQFKLIGLTIAGLKPYVPQLSLFGLEERLRGMVLALDKINQKYGDFTICRVPVLAAKMAFRDSIGFGRIKEK